MKKEYQKNASAKCESKLIPNFQKPRKISFHSQDTDKPMHYYLILMLKDRWYCPLYVFVYQREINDGLIFNILIYFNFLTS